MSADYDKVEGFFQDMRSYLCRLKILENPGIVVPELKLAMTEVFTSILSLCAICTKYIKAKRAGMSLGIVEIRLFVLASRCRQGVIRYVTLTDLSADVLLTVFLFFFGSSSQSVSSTGRGTRCRFKGRVREVSQASGTGTRDCDEHHSRPAGDSEE